MDNINILEELGLQEVSRKTHIEVKFLKFMINKEFDQLNRINTLGFAKILKREYDIDLDSWLEEFDAYWKEHRQGGAPQESTASLVAQENIPQKSSKAWIFLVLLLALIGGGVWYLNDMGYFSSFQAKPTKVVQTPKEEPQNNELEEPMDSVDDVQIADINETKEELNVTIADVNVTDVNESVSEDNNETNATEEQVTQEDDSSDEVYIQPKRRIWVGIVDLETRKKSQYTTSKMITISLNKPQIIITGHGSFTLLYDNGKEETPDTKRTLYYYVDGGTMTRINKKEFITYNGGRPW